MNTRVWIALVLLLLPLTVFAQPPAISNYLAYLNNPDVTYLLLLVAVLGLFFEISNPGMILPGIVGFASLILVLYAFLWVPVDYSALTLLLIGIVFMVFEAFVFSYGLFAIFGLLAFVLGSVTLFGLQNPHYHVSWLLIATMATMCMAFFFIVIHLAIQSYKQVVVTGREGIIGKQGRVLKVEGNRIKVRVLGEIWDATSTHKVHTDEMVEVRQIDGLLLTIAPIKERR